MQYPPVDFQLLSDLMSIASVEDEAEAAKCLQSFLTQLDLYEPSARRDYLRELVEGAKVAPRLIPTAINELNKWAIAAATEQTRQQMSSWVKRTVSGQKGGKKRKGVSADRHEAWIQAAQKMRDRNKHRSAEDMGRAIADTQDDEVKGDTVARVLRKAGF